MLVTQEKKRTKRIITPPEPESQENFTSLLDPLKQPKTLKCVFDLFAVKRPDQPKFKNGLLEMTHRGDKWEKFNEGKMLWYLVSICINHKNIHNMMVLYHNPNPEQRGEVILKYLHGEWKINRLPDYAHLLKNYKLPEYLSYEIKI